MKQDPCPVCSRPVDAHSYDDECAGQLEVLPQLEALPQVEPLAVKQHPCRVCSRPVDAHSDEEAAACAGQLDARHAGSQSLYEPLHESATSQPVCCLCGCTEAAACADGCAWATLDPPTCTACSAGRMAMVQLELVHGDTPDGSLVTIRATAGVLIFPPGDRFELKSVQVHGDGDLLSACGTVDQPSDCIGPALQAAFKRGDVREPPQLSVLHLSEILCRTGGAW